MNARRKPSAEQPASAVRARPANNRRALELAAPPALRQRASNKRPARPTWTQTQRRAALAILKEAATGDGLQFAHLAHLGAELLHDGPDTCFHTRAATLTLALAIVCRAIGDHAANHNERVGPNLCRGEAERIASATRDALPCVRTILDALEAAVEEEKVATK